MAEEEAEEIEGETLEDDAAKVETPGEEQEFGLMTSLMMSKDKYKDMENVDKDKDKDKDMHKDQGKDKDKG